MNGKRFEYFHKDIKQLQTDIIVRFVFSALFLGTFVWQIVSILLTSMKGSISLPQGISSIIVLTTTFLLCLVTMSFAFKDLRIIAAIKMRGKCVSTIQILFKVDGKRNFLWLYKFIMTILALATTLVLIAAVTYGVLQVAFFATVSFYMPLLLTICLASYNSIYHIKDEITTQKTVQQQQPLY